MSFLRKMFGAGGKGDNVSTIGQAIGLLRETEEMLITRQRYLEKQIDQKLDIAKKNQAMQRGEKLIILLGCICSSLILSDFVVIVVIQALKLKKFYYKNLQQNDADITKIEMMRERMEFLEDIDEASLIACISSCLQSY